MNGIGNQFRSILFIAGGDKTPPEEEQLQKTCGTHLGCVLYTSTSVNTTICDEKSISEIVLSFCNTESIPCSCVQDIGSITSEQPLSIIIGKNSDVPELRRRLSAESYGADYLLTIINVTAPAKLKSETRFYNAFGFPYSFASEIAQNEGKPLESLRQNGCFTVFPLHMYSSAAIVRNCGTRFSDDEAFEECINKCTLEAILRELAYKCGYYAKYGA